MSIWRRSLDTAIFGISVITMTYEQQHQLVQTHYTNGLVQEKRKSSVLAMSLSL